MAGEEIRDIETLIQELRGIEKDLHCDIHKDRKGKRCAICGHWFCDDCNIIHQRIASAHFLYGQNLLFPSPQQPPEFPFLKPGKLL